MRIRADHGPHSVIEVVHGEIGTLEAEVVTRVGTMEYSACSLARRITRAHVRDGFAEVTAVESDASLIR